MVLKKRERDLRESKIRAREAMKVAPIKEFERKGIQNMSKLERRIKELKQERKFLRNSISRNKLSIKSQSVYTINGCFKSGRVGKKERSSQHICLSKYFF